jgi:hypothetical protein
MNDEAFKQLSESLPSFDKGLVFEKSNDLSKPNFVSPLTDIDSVSYKSSNGPSLITKVSEPLNVLELIDNDDHSDGVGADRKSFVLFLHKKYDDEAPLKYNIIGRNILLACNSSAELDGEDSRNQTPGLFSPRILNSDASAFKLVQNGSSASENVGIFGGGSPRSLPAVYPLNNSLRSALKSLVYPSGSIQDANDCSIFIIGPLGKGICH